MNWLSLAACKGHPNPEIFFPLTSGVGNAAEAKAVCAECPVTDDCLAFAMSHQEQHGIWGGLSERERRRYRRTLEVYVRKRRGVA